MGCGEVKICTNYIENNNHIYWSSYKQMWMQLKLTLQTDYNCGHVQKSSRALMLIKELEEKFDLKD